MIELKQLYRDEEFIDKKIVRSQEYADELWLAFDDGSFAVVEVSEIRRSIGAGTCLVEIGIVSEEENDAVHEKVREEKEKRQEEWDLRELRRLLEKYPDEVPPA